MNKIQRGVAILHYNRQKYLPEIVEATLKTTPQETRIVVCDDGSDSLPKLPDEAILIQGANKGVIANRNRALFALQDCTFFALIEDDLKPIKEAWFNYYETATILSEIHHWCRVQDKEITESEPEFQKFMQSNSLTPIYGPSPRGDLIFGTSLLLSKIGGYDSRFKGVGHGHKEWSSRAFRSGLIKHANKWCDIKEARDCFVQLGDTVGGRWERPRQEIENQIRRNRKIYDEVKNSGNLFQPLILE